MELTELKKKAKNIRKDSTIRFFCYSDDVALDVDILRLSLYDKIPFSPV